jgi:hypothetical protein
VLSVSPVVGIGTKGGEGRAHSLAAKGVGESQSNEGTYTVVLYIYKYFVLSLVFLKPSKNIFLNSVSFCQLFVL